MNKLALLFSLLLLLGGTVRGQSKVWEAPNVKCDTTIVRHWQGEEYITYSRSAGAEGTIAYHDNVSGNIITAEVPSDAVVNDFRIAHDTIFAGGSFDNSGSRTGFLACMAISDLLSGSGQFNMFVFLDRDLSSNGQCSVDYKIRIVGVKRIALYDDGGATRIAYIADNHLTDINNSSLVYYRLVGFGDAAFVSPGYWDLCQYHYNKDGIEAYTDICTTYNKIVVVARASDYSCFRFQVFDKMRDYASFVYNGTFTDRPGFVDHEVDGRVMVTHVTGDLVAAAYHFTDASSEGLAIRLLDVSSAPSLAGATDVLSPQVSVAGGHINDVRYDAGTGKLVMLNRMDEATHGWDSYVVTADLPSLTSSASDANYTAWVSYLHSLDNYKDGRYIASGYGGYDHLHIRNDVIVGSEQCGVGIKLLAVPVSPNMVTVGRHHCTVKTWYDPIIYMYTNNSIHAFVTTEDEINLRCER